VLVIIDPIKAFLRGDDSDEIGVRSQLGAFVRIAQYTGATVIGVRHWTKGARAADERGGGSIAYGAIARATLGVGIDEDGRRALFVIESSSVREGHAITFELEGDENSGRPPQARWGERCMVNPNDFAMADLAAKKQEKPGEEAAEALEEILADGPVDKKEAIQRVRDACPSASVRTIERAASKLEVITRRQGFGKPAFWVLPQSRHDGTPGGETGGETGQKVANGPNEPDGAVMPRVDHGESVRTAEDGAVNADLPFSPHSPAPRDSGGETGEESPGEAFIREHTARMLARAEDDA
jgi:hypothetical protein